jgi:hypothetical protein
VFAAVQIVMPLWVRPHFIPPSHAATALNPAAIDFVNTSGNGRLIKVGAAVDLPGAWVLSQQMLTPGGHVFTGPAPTACMSTTAPVSECDAALARLDLRQLVTFQPASRYWAFQWYEAGVFLVLAGALCGCCAWVIRRVAP